MPRPAKPPPKPLRKRKLGPMPATPTALSDPLAINTRLYRQVGLLLDQLEEQEEAIDFKARIAALIAVGRIQTIFVNLRKENKDGGPRAGSSVRKYATAFQNDTRRGAARPRDTSRAVNLTGDDLADLGDDAA